jgi:hypothetical protein
MPRKRQSFGGSFDASFKGFDETSKKSKKKYDLGDDDPYKFTPDDYSITSRIRFYDHDSLWTRWRRGYDLYCITQSVLGSTALERNNRGDYRMYLAFQQFPGIFVSARVFTFPSSNSEIKQQVVAIRDADSFNFYDYGLPIESVRYLTSARNATYSQTGTTIIVALDNHGLYPGQSVYLEVSTGSALTETLTITATTQNTFTCTATSSFTTSGNLTVRQSTSFDNPVWTEMRVGIRYLPTPVNFFEGERLADRVTERDPGVSLTYSQSGLTNTITCSSDHGLSTGNEVFLEFSSGNATTGLYNVTVTSSTQFTVQSVLSFTTTGSGICYRRIRGYEYNDYVGYTVTGINIATNEILFQRDDSYATTIINDKAETISPAARGFELGRYLTTEIRYQCTCPDYSRRETFNLFKESDRQRFPRTPAGIVKPGQRITRDNTVINTRDDVGVYSEFGYVAVNNFYNLVGYEDKANFSAPNLLYYQPRWCKHIYAALWSLVHDEGNESIDRFGIYVQSGGPNITINIENHGLSVNTRVDIEFTSGNALSGEYTITQVIDSNNFIIIYPINQTTLGYCQVQNLKRHQYIDTWLREPNDQPIGDALNKFYERAEKENESTRKQAERLLMLDYGLPWFGNKEITGNRNLPEDVANFDLNITKSILTDTVRRDPTGLSEDGVLLNQTTTMLLSLNKVFNISPEFIQNVRIGMINQPLTSYTNTFEFGYIDTGSYLNGVPAAVASNSVLDCGLYNPSAAQTIFVDAGPYINT